MKIAILGDVHVGMRNDAELFHEALATFFQTVFFPRLKDEGITTIIQVGDLFDRRKYINFESLAKSRAYFFDPLRDLGLTMYVLVGNHDMFWKETAVVNSPDLLLKGYANIHVIQTPQTVQFDETPLCLIPWLCDDNTPACFQEMQDTRAEICIGHFEIQGFKVTSTMTQPTGIDRALFQKFDLTLSGHFHHISKEDHIQYVGTPVEQTWNDFQDPKGFHILDTATRDLTFVVNSDKIFHRLVYDDTVQDYTYWMNADLSRYRHTYLKVVVVNKTNTHLFDTVMDRLYKVDVADITIVEDTMERAMSALDDSALASQAEDTMTFISRQIDGLTLPLDANRLKGVVKEIYVEALNRETLTA